MATKGFIQPFYIVDKDSIDVGARVDGEFCSAYGCSDIPTAIEICLALNVIWQQMQYGSPDPALWIEFRNRGFDQLYTREDMFEIFDTFSDMGLMAGTVH